MSAQVYATKQTETARKAREASYESQDRETDVVIAEAHAASRKARRLSESAARFLESTS